MRQSLQEQHALHSICYGCGRSNPSGLHVRSVAEADETTCDWLPSPHHEART